jgi:hypothetical protein
VKAPAPTSWCENKPAAMLDLTTKEWIHPPGSEWIPWIEMPRSFARNRLQNMPIKGRNSREEKDAEKTADEILRSKSWIVSNETPFHIVEQLVLMLCVSLRPLISLHALSRAHLITRWCDSQKRLDKWTSMESTIWSWCVGGSLAATYASRDVEGRASFVKLTVCQREDWPGGKRSNKVGNSCMDHCAGIQFDRANINGKMYDSIFLKKCTWLRCCYGKKPYGNPPGVPWCDKCEYQKKRVRCAHVLPFTFALRW